ncbi:hypothetical protein [Mycobacterium kyorinense]|uniref:hypothetical protein n=1 Tax=Mycobacterium kyorinense TaxID=487514 RepID=UPI0011548071|nr:hypothetical protein [Mycobacterium kyorinense]
MTDGFPAEVEAVVGPLLADLGFTLDEVDNNVDEGGRRGSVVYYRSDDCKIQVYRSSREGSVNCMIAPLDASNVFGLSDQSYKWQYFTKFSPAVNVSLEELVQQVSFEPQTDKEQLEWVRDRIVEYFDVAHAGILEME